MPPSVRCPHCTRQISLDLLRLSSWKGELERQPGAIEGLAALLPANRPPVGPQEPHGSVRNMLRGLGLGL